MAIIGSVSIPNAFTIKTTEDSGPIELCGITAVVVMMNVWVVFGRLGRLW